MRRCRRSISRQTNSAASGTILLLQTNNQPEAVIYRQALRLILVLSDKKQRPFWTLCRLYKMQHGLVACAVRCEKLLEVGSKRPSSYATASGNAWVRSGGTPQAASNDGSTPLSRAETEKFLHSGNEKLARSAWRHRSINSQHGSRSKPSLLL